jgi:hypothetical protein
MLSVKRPAIGTEIGPLGSSVQVPLRKRAPADLKNDGEASLPRSYITARSRRMGCWDRSTSLRRKDRPSVLGGVAGWRVPAMAVAALVIPSYGDPQGFMTPVMSGKVRCS